jgi:hypothetical protein
VLLGKISVKDNAIAIRDILIMVWKIKTVKNANIIV